MHDRRLRLPVAPLLLAGVVALGLAEGPAQGRDGIPTTATRLASTVTTADAPDRRQACVPPYSDGRRTAVEPWRGRLRAGSERRFDRHMSRENRVFVRGRHGWVFYSDLFNENFSQALGRTTQTPHQERTWARYLRRAQRSVTAAGGQFFVVVSPANWDVYHQELPRWAQPLRGTTSLERLMADYPGLPWIDVRPALAAAAETDDTYEPTDGHWTPYGGWVAWRAITACLRASRPGDDDLRAPPLADVGVGPNPNEFAAYGVPDGRPQYTYPIYARPHPETQLTSLVDGTAIPLPADGSIDETVGPARASTPEGMSPLRLLVLRDSTGNAISPDWDWTFRTSFSYEHGIAQEDAPAADYPALMSALHPDVVLLVLTERFLAENPNR